MTPAPPIMSTVFIKAVVRITRRLGGIVRFQTLLLTTGYVLRGAQHSIEGSFHWREFLYLLDHVIIDCLFKFLATFVHLRRFEESPFDLIFYKPDHRNGEGISIDRTRRHFGYKMELGKMFLYEFLIWSEW